MTRKMLCVFFAGVISAGIAFSQTWPELHLTNGTHYTSYGAEDYDPLNPVKNLYIDPVAVLYAGFTELNDIYDGNQVYLSGGTVHASSIDAADFTWYTGNLHLAGGTHSSTYGLNSRAGKILSIESGATVQQTSMSALPAGNELNLYEGGKLSVGDFNASMDGFHYNGGMLEVAGVLSGYNPRHTDMMFYERSASRLVLSGSSASWDLGSDGLQISESHDYHADSLLVTNGATVLSGGVTIGKWTRAFGGGYEVEVVGTDSHLSSSGDVEIGKLSSNNRLVISGGGTVEGDGGLSCGNGALNEESLNNEVVVTGVGSRLDIGSELVAGGARAENNSVVVGQGGRLGSVGGSIGTRRGGVGNSVSVNGGGSRWDNTGDLNIGWDVSSYGNGLYVSGGGVVSNMNASIGSDNGLGLNRVSVRGEGSKWVVDGTLTIGNGSGGASVGISSGGEAVVSGNVGIYRGDSGNELYLRGGKLTVGADFDASMEGFGFYSGSTLAVEGQLSGLPTLELGRTLEAADVLGDLTVHGTFAPGMSPADSIVGGELTIAPDGTLEMELGGYVPGEEHDRLTVTDAAYLDGTLDIVLVDGFSLKFGDSFDLFNWGIKPTTTFSNITEHALTGGLEWDASELYTTGRLNVVPEPATASLMGLSSGMLLLLRRFRRRRKAVVSFFPIRCPHDTQLSFDKPVQQTWGRASKPSIGVSESFQRVPELQARIASARKAASNRLWDALLAWDRAVDRATAKLLACFDAFLALVMK